MSTATKLSYLNTTKEKIKDSLNYSGCNITDEPFRQYASILKDKFISVISNPEEQADVIYNNMPKAINTGTHITTTTYNTRFDMTLLGDTIQEGTPTPTNPQNINVVTGNQVVDLHGKNYFDGEVENGYININTGVNTGNTNVRTKNYVEIQPNTQYTISDNNQYKDTWGIFYDKNKTYLSYLQLKTYQNNSGTFTSPNNAYYVRWYNAATSAGTIPLWQLEKGNQATLYEPYKGNTYEVNLGKNLCNIVLDSSIANTILYKQYTLQPNTQYVVSSNTYWQEQNIANVFAEAGTSIAPSTSGNGVINSRVITSDNNGNIIIGYRNYDQHFNYSSGNYYIQIEKGTQATSYSPYFTPIELCKIGNYQDKIYKSGDTWYLHKEIGKVVYTGASSESWTDAGAITNVRRFYTTIADAKQNDSSNTKYSNYFTYIYNYNLDSEHFYIADNGRLIMFSSETSLANFKTWLSTHNTSVYYPLATSTDTEITNEELINQLDDIRLLDGFNEITVNGDLPTILFLKTIPK